MAVDLLGDEKQHVNNLGDLETKRHRNKFVICSECLARKIISFKRVFNISILNIRIFAV